MRLGGHGQKVGDHNAALPGQLPAQLVSLAVVAAKADGVDLADSESDQVVDDRPGRARLGADLDHIVHLEPGLDRNVFLGGIDVQISIEEEVAHDRDLQSVVTTRDGREAIGVHGKKRRR